MEGIVEVIAIRSALAVVGCEVGSLTVVKHTSNDIRDFVLSYASSDVLTVATAIDISTTC